MATITITVPNPVANRVQDAICIKYGYTGFLIDGVTPQTKSDFVKAWIISQIKNAVKDHEANTAAASARTSAANDVETNVILT